MRVVLAPGPVAGLPAHAAELALRSGWASAAPGDELVPVPVPPGQGSAAAVTRLAEVVPGADLVVTATSVLDADGLAPGGAVSTAAAAAAEHGVPCVALAREVRLGQREQGAAGLADALALEPGLAAVRPDGAAEGLRRLAQQVAREWSPT